MFAEYYRRYRTENKDKLNELQRHYFDQYKDKQNDYQRYYRAQNKDKSVAMQRQYYVLKQHERRLSRRMRYIRQHAKRDAYQPRNGATKSWKTPELVREYLDSIAERLAISTFTDWYRVSREQILALGGLVTDRLVVTPRELLRNEV